jgi:hypothetical protein
VAAEDALGERWVGGGGRRAGGRWWRDGLGVQRVRHLRVGRRRTGARPVRGPTSRQVTHAVTLLGRRRLWEDTAAAAAALRRTAPIIAGRSQNHHALQDHGDSDQEDCRSRSLAHSISVLCGGRWQVRSPQRNQQGLSLGLPGTPTALAPVLVPSTDLKLDIPHRQCQSYLQLNRPSTPMTGS